MNRLHTLVIGMIAAMVIVPARDAKPVEKKPDPKGKKGKAKGKKAAKRETATKIIATIPVGGGLTADVEEPVKPEPKVAKKAKPAPKADPTKEWKAFHDAFLSYGGPPIPLVRKAMIAGDKGSLF